MWLAPSTFCPPSPRSRRCRTARHCPRRMRSHTRTGSTRSSGCQRHKVCRLGGLACLGKEKHITHVFRIVGKERFWISIVLEEKPREPEPTALVLALLSSSTWSHLSTNTQSPANTYFLEKPPLFLASFPAYKSRFPVLCLSPKHISLSKQI